MTEQAQTPQKPLPCPFCGNEKVSIREGSTYRWARAECDVCGAAAGDIRRQYGQGVDDPEVQTAAIAEWNIRDRREIDALKAEVARLTPIDGIYQAFLVFAANPTADAAVEFTEQAVKIAEAAADAQAKKVQA